MKRIKVFLVILLMVAMAGCGGDRQSTDNLIKVDVTKHYPKKEMILQDFMDVEYIPLETNDEFVTSGRIGGIGEKYLVILNLGGENGDVFIFDRNGKGIRKINRRGQGPEEYLYAHNVILDEDNGEVMIDDGSKKSIFVYDLFGNFKRKLNHIENVRYYGKTLNFNKEYLLFWNSNFEFPSLNPIEMPSFFIISKQDGNILKEIEIPVKQRVSTVINTKYGLYSTAYNSIIPYKDQFVLFEPSSDTIYSYSLNHQLKPVIVRHPSVHSMDPKEFLFPGTVTDRYFFMKTTNNDYTKDINFAKGEKLPETELVYDRETKTLYESAVLNGDYSTPKIVSMTDYFFVNQEIAMYFFAHKLIEDYKKGILKGKLAEIAATLDPEDNPVIMLIKPKK